MTTGNETPLVSICCATYNHAKYIKQALDSFLMQQVNFPVEIIVHDDASTDGTSAIIREYAAKNPSILAVIQPVNLMSQGLNPTFEHGLFKARGKYVVLCEGDDYWTDPHKLQKQFDFLEQNPDFSLCFHEVQVLKDGQLQKDDMPDVNSVTTIADLAGGNYIRTCSVMFRNSLIKNLPDNFFDAPGPDYFLFLLVAAHGKIKKFTDEMAVYRKHSEGIWSSKDSITRFKSTLKNLEVFIPHFNGEVKQILKERHAETIFRFAVFLGDHTPDDETIDYIYKSMGFNSDTVLKKIGQLTSSNDMLHSRQQSLKFAFKNILRLTKGRLS